MQAPHVSGASAVQTEKKATRVTHLSDKESLLHHPGPCVLLSRPSWAVTGGVSSWEDTFAPRQKVQEATTADPNRDLHISVVVACKDPVLAPRLAFVVPQHSWFPPKPLRLRKRQAVIHTYVPACQLLRPCTHAQRAYLHISMERL